MLGIIRNKFKPWSAALRLLPEDFVEVFSLGYLVLVDFKISKYKMTWWPCVLYLGSDLIVVLSLGYFTTNWANRYWITLKSKLNDPDFWSKR